MGVVHGGKLAAGPLADAIDFSRAPLDIVANFFSLSEPSPQIASIQCWEVTNDTNAFCGFAGISPLTILFFSSQKIAAQIS